MLPKTSGPIPNNVLPPRLSNRVLQLCGFVLIWVFSAHASAGELDLDDSVLRESKMYELSGADESYSFVEQQIYRGEAGSALNRLNTEIEQIELIRHRYHEDLIVPLTLAGDALMVQREFDKALDNYERARHIARVSTGLFAESQLPVVYREADAFRRIGDLGSTAKREEYAYEIAKKAFGDYTLETLDSLYRLADFYLETYNYLSARSLYNRALGIIESHQLGNAPEAITALRGIAVSHRLARFPPFYVHSANDNSRFEGPRPGLTVSDLEDQHIAFNNFPAGEKALQRIVEIQRKNTPEDSEALAQAITALGDWHLMFGRSNAANVLYKHVATEVDATTQLPASSDADAPADPAGPMVPDTPTVSETQLPSRFADPTLIYFPVPNDPSVPKTATPDQGQKGFVKLGFDVGTTGKIRKLKTLEAYPPKLMEFRVRRSIRQAVFRPRLENGVAVVAGNQSYTHYFTFYPNPEDYIETEAASSSPEESPPPSTAEPEDDPV
ncbi:MAG: hypothetical protein AAF541_18785 [Pseudomonadota bacterium]